MLEKNCFCVGFLRAYFGQSIEMPCKCGSQVFPRPGEQLSSHTHEQAWMLSQGPDTVRNTAAPAPIPTRRHGKLGHAGHVGHSVGSSDCGAELTQWPARERAQNYRNAVNTVCIQKRSVCGRQLRTGMRVSCDKHGLPPLSPTKSQTRLSEGKAQSFVCS